MSGGLGTARWAHVAWAVVLAVLCYRYELARTELESVIRENGRLEASLVTLRSGAHPSAQLLRDAIESDSGVGPAGCGLEPERDQYLSDAHKRATSVLAQDSTACDSCFRRRKKSFLSESESLPPSQIGQQVNASQLVELYRSMYHNKQKEKPVFMFSFGPPASGKSSIIGRMMQKYHINRDTFVEVGIDSMLESLDAYKMGMAEAERVRHAACAGGGMCQVFIERSQAVYHQYRPIVYFFKDALMDMAFRERLNILFETTGKSTRHIDELIERARYEGYQVQLIMPFVSEESRHKRLEARNRESSRAMDEDFVRRVASASLRNFAKLLPRVDRAYIYDNEGPADGQLEQIFAKSSAGELRCQQLDREERFAPLRDALAEFCKGDQ